MPATSHAATLTLTAQQARTVAVHAAGTPRSFGTVSDVLRHLGSVQLDAIGVLAKAHQLTVASRLRHRATVTDIDDELWHQGRAIAFEYPAHAAALVAIDDWPLWAFRRRASRTRKEYPDEKTRKALLTRIGQDGALTLRELRDGNDAGQGGWDWSPTKTAVEFLVWSGELACVTRGHDNHRRFDLARRAIPAPHLTDELGDEDCVLRLLDRAGQVLGIATTDDLADYIRVRNTTVRTLLPGTNLIPVSIEGWKGPAWAHEHALTHADNTIDDATFLGPFDNLIWYRKRISRLFGFEHVLEAYKPAAKRQHGYYVCPLRVGTQLVGRADLSLRQGALTILQIGLDALTGRTISGFAQACYDLASTLQATTIEIRDGAANTSTLTALRQATST